VAWRFKWPWSALTRVDRRLAGLAAARLTVWEREELCKPGQEYMFGGTEGSIPREDHTYLLAWHPVWLPEEAGVLTRAGATAMPSMLGTCVVRTPTSVRSWALRGEGAFSFHT
jgi:hypothetical protein